MNRIHIQMTTLAAMLVLAGCAKEIENTPDDRDSAAIELSSVSTDPLTKAVITGTEFTTSEAEAGIGLFLLDGKGNAYGSNPANVRYGYSDGKWTAASPLRVGGTAGTLYGYYPYSEGVTDITAIPVASSINGTDYLYAAPVEVNSSNAKNVSLSLSHALARVSLSFRLDESYSGSGAFSAISLSGDCVAASGTLNAKTGGIDASKGAFSADGLDRTVTKSGSTVVECLVVPAAIESGTPELRIACTIDGKAYAMTFTGDPAALASGKQTTIELTVKNTSITVDGSSIGAWGDGGSQTVTVGGDYTVTVAYSSDTGIEDDVWIRNVEVVNNSVVVTVHSVSGQHLKCTMDDGEFCTSQSKTGNLVYSFTISDITENTTATIGYANPVSIAVSPSNAKCKVAIKGGELYEGESVRLVPEAAYSYGISSWKDQDDNLLSDGYDYTVRLSKDVQITACFEENLVLGGVFTVANDDKGNAKNVRFTRGNLYFDGSSKIEQLQYDFNSASYTSSTAHVSHFMWCNNIADATSKQYDTGWDGQSPFFTNDNNFTVNGFIKAGSCFALSKDEWNHLLTGRAASTVNGTTNARYFKGCIQKEDGTSMTGMFIFPDVFTWPLSVKNLPDGINEASSGYDNTYTYNDFKRLQDAGIVFLPAAGYRRGGTGSTTISFAGSFGCYWSTSSNYDYSVFDLNFYSGIVNPGRSDARSQAYSVRLVTDYE